MLVRNTTTVCVITQKSAVLSVSQFNIYRPACIYSFYIQFVFIWQVNHLVPVFKTVA
jgi:hypothetical protein